MRETLATRRMRILALSILLLADLGLAIAVGFLDQPRVLVGGILGAVLLTRLLAAEVTRLRRAALLLTESAWGRAGLSAGIVAVFLLTRDLLMVLAVAAVLSVAYAAWFLRFRRIPAG